MSTKEELRKQQEEDRINQAALEREIAQAEEQEKRNKLNAQSAQIDRLKPLPDLQKPVQLQLSGDDKDWQKILSAFKEKYPETPVENNTLSFPTKDDAINFFTAQATATPPAKFLCKEIDADGKPTGFNVFSCGNSKLYQGSLQEIHEQLTADQKATPDDPRWSRYLVIDFSHPWLKSTRQRAKCLTPTVLRPARCAERASVCLPQ